MRHRARKIPAGYLSGLTAVYADDDHLDDRARELAAAGWHVDDIVAVLRVPATQVHRWIAEDRQS